MAERIDFGKAPSITIASKSIHRNSRNDRHTETIRRLPDPSAQSRAGFTPIVRERHKTEGSLPSLRIMFSEYRGKRNESGFEWAVA